MTPKRIEERRQRAIWGVRVRRNGFSLVELLIVIAVTSFVLAIAAMSVGGILARGEEVVARHNAQHIATVASVVTASGSDAVTSAPDLETAIDRLLDGVQARYIEGGYRIAFLSAEAREEATVLLRLEDGRISLVD